MVSKKNAVAVVLHAVVGSLLGDAGAAQRSPSQAADESRIINGQPADVADYPFLVSLRRFENGEISVCAGSVLNPRVVLTAAHCVVPEDGEPFGTPYNSVNNFMLPFVVTAADVPVDDPDSGDIPAANLVATKAVVTSAGWNGYTSNGYDIALLLLEEDLVDVEVVSLPPAGTTYTAGEAFNIAGWGNTSPTEDVFPTTLMEATVNYVPRRTCYDALIETGGALLTSEGFALDNTWMCAQGAFVDGYYTDTCSGDSGGPMSIIDDTGRATVVGIVSWGYGCGEDTPGVYANVEYYTPWIEHWLSVWEDK